MGVTVWCQHSTVSYYQGQEAEYVEGEHMGAWVRKGTLSWPSVFKWRIHSQTITGMLDDITVITARVCLSIFVVFIHCSGLKTNIN